MSSKFYTWFIYFIPRRKIIVKLMYIKTKNEEAESLVIKTKTLKDQLLHIKDHENKTKQKK